MTYLSVYLCFKLNCYVDYKGLFGLCMLVLGLRWGYFGMCLMLDKLIVIA